jgi:asparagine synthase (glutamine-hydrolysing)
MILGAIGQNDRAAREIVDRLVGELPAQFVACSVSNRIAIACFSGVAGVTPAFADDHAYVGQLRGSFPDATAELRGDFALIARTSDGLRLARGRFAGRPLYWMRTGATVVASSRLLPLAILMHPELRLNVEYVLALFDQTFNLLRGPLPFVGLEKVHTNTIVDVDSSGNARTRSGPFHLQPELKLPTRELASALRQEFAAAVERQCAGATRVAVLTGGGVDSSNLLATTVRNARQKNTADVIPVALDFGGVGDDRPHLRAVCDHLGINPLRVSPSEGVRYAGGDWCIDGTAHAAIPLSTTIALLSRAKSAGADLALLGDGSEWLLDAAPAVFGDFLLKRPLQGLRCAARYQGIFQTRPEAWRTLLLGPLMRRILPRPALELRRSRMRRRTAAHREENFSWMGPKLTAFLSEPRESPSFPAVHSQQSRVAQLTTSALVMMYRELTSQWEMAVDLPISFPYLDDDYVRFVSRIPSEAIFAGARERGLLRESMEGLVPDSVRYRMDKSLGHEAFAQILCAMGADRAIGDLVTMRELDKLGIVDPKRFGTAFEAFAKNPREQASAQLTLWSAITAEGYVRWFNDFKAGNVSRSASPPSVTAQP